MNLKNKEFFQKEYEKHLQEGGNMPHECALTNLVNHAIKNKDYQCFFIEDRSTIDKSAFKLYDVIAWDNISCDVGFGVLMEWDSNDMVLETGTANGVFTKIL
jgi:hypothetical protein